MSITLCFCLFLKLTRSKSSFYVKMYLLWDLIIVLYVVMCQLGTNFLGIIICGKKKSKQTNKQIDKKTEKGFSTFLTFARGFINLLQFFQLQKVFHTIMSLLASLSSTKANKEKR